MTLLRKTGPLLLAGVLSCSEPQAAPDLAPEPVADLASPVPADLARAAPQPGPNQQYNALSLFIGPDLQRFAFSGTGYVGDAVELRKGPMGTCLPEDIAGGAARFDAASGLCQGADPIARGAYPGAGSYYNGGAFFFGTLTSPVLRPERPIDHVIASFNGRTPPGTWIEIRVRIEKGAGFGRWYPLGVWARTAETVKRHSTKGVADADGSVDTDTFLPRRPAASYQLGLTLFSERADLSPAVTLVAGLASRDAADYLSLPSDRAAWGKELDVPARSQELPEYKGQGYGGGGEVWCSPTSTSMVLGAFAIARGQAALDHKVPDAAAGCYDWVYDGTGNWPFNTAFAALPGLLGYVTRLYSFTEAEPSILTGVPLIISIAYGPGELPGSPIQKTAGHLLVVRGFTASGDVITNDPAAAGDDKVRIVYPRAALERAWSHSHRTAYVIR